jgi:hypothetical protein
LHGSTTRSTYIGQSFNGQEDKLENIVLPHKTQKTSYYLRNRWTEHSVGLAPHILELVGSILHIAPRTAKKGPALCGTRPFLSLPVPDVSTTKVGNGGNGGSKRSKRLKKSKQKQVQKNQVQQARQEKGVRKV